MPSVMNPATPSAYTPALMSAAAQVEAATFGSVPPGYRPVTLSRPGAAMTRYGPRVMRPTPGYGKRRTGSFMATAGAVVSRVGASNPVRRDYGTARAFPAEFAVRPNLMGLAETAFAPAVFDFTGGSPLDWKWSGPLLPLVGMVVGAVIGGTLVKSPLKGGAVGTVIGWLTMAGVSASLRRGAVDART